MGNCSGSPPQVVSPPQVGGPEPPSPDRNDTYERLKIILCESYDSADGLQKYFAVNVIQSKILVNIIRASDKLLDGVLITEMSEEVAKEIAENTNKELEKYWLQNSNEIISIVKFRLTVVEGHHSVGTEQQPSLFNLITKIKTNVLHLFAMLYDMQSESQQSNDADEVNRSSTERNNESSNSLKEVGKSESSYRVEISKIFNGRHDQIMDFVWLYECTLLLQHESHNYCRICSYITPSKKMREL